MLLALQQPEQSCRRRPAEVPTPRPSPLIGATIVYVTHDQIEAMTMATRIAIMWQGQLQQLGTPRELYDLPANTFVAIFIGSPSMNLMPAKLVLDDGKLCAALNGAGGPTAGLPLADNSAWEAHLGRDVILGLRPEHISDPANAEAARAGPSSSRLRRRAHRTHGP